MTNHICRPLVVGLSSQSPSLHVVRWDKLETKNKRIRLNSVKKVQILGKSYDFEKNSEFSGKSQVADFYVKIMQIEVRTLQ